LGRLNLPAVKARAVIGQRQLPVGGCVHSADSNKRRDRGTAIRDEGTGEVDDILRRPFAFRSSGWNFGSGLAVLQTTARQLSEAKRSGSDSEKRT
jgi:hypothetical protein